MEPKSNVVRFHAAVERPTASPTPASETKGQSVTHSGRVVVVVGPATVANTRLATARSELDRRQQAERQFQQGLHSYSTRREIRERRCVIIGAGAWLLGSAAATAGFGYLAATADGSPNIFSAALGAVLGGVSFVGSAIVVGSWTRAYCRYRTEPATEEEWQQQAAIRETKQAQTAQAHREVMQARRALLAAHIANATGLIPDVANIVQAFVPALELPER